MDLKRIQESLKREKLDGWLFFDHHVRDALAYRVMGVTPPGHVTRRWYYFIQAEGEPQGLVHRIESKVIHAAPGEKLLYSSWPEQQDGLARKLLSGAKRVAMQYSPRCAIPYIAMVDAGTVELVREFGVEVVGSGPSLFRSFTRLASVRSMFESHLVSRGRRMDGIRAGAFRFIGENIGSGVDEIAVAEWMRGEYRKNGLVTDSGPVVAVNAHAGDPHYEPSAESSAPIRAGDFVLIDMWAKLDRPGSVYYDITWTGYCGDAPQRSLCRCLEIVRDAPR